MIFSCAVLIAPLGSPVARPVPRPIAHSARFVSSSRRPVISHSLIVLFYHHLIRARPIHGGETTTTGQATRTVAWRSFMRRFRQLVIVRPVIGFSSSVGVRSSRPPPWRPRCEFSHHLIRLISPVPIASGSSRRRWCLSSFKQATASWRPLSSAHHLITSRGRWRRWRRWRLVRASRLMRLVHRLVLYRDINGGVGGGADEASKRTRKNGRNRDEKPGQETGEQDGAKDGNEHK